MDEVERLAVLIDRLRWLSDPRNVKLSRWKKELSSVAEDINDARRTLAADRERLVRATPDEIDVVSRKLNTMNIRRREQTIEILEHLVGRIASG